MASNYQHSSMITHCNDSKIKDDVVVVPQNYVIPDQESPISTSVTVPTIDMEKLFSINHCSINHELDKLHSILKEWGIFQLVNHGVNCTLLENLKQELEEFFKLPLEEKMRYKVRPGDVEGYGTVGRSQDENLDWGNRFYMTVNPISVRKPHLFPQLPTSLRNTLEDYLLELQRIGRTLLGLIGQLLKTNLEEMADLFEDGIQSLRINHYPPCPKPELVVGVRPHSDAGALTILNQVNGVDGLHIKKDGIWFPVTFDPNAFAVHVGDILEILSDGIYKSIEHMAAVNSEKERVSIAMFFNAKLEAEIGPLTSLRDPHKPPSFTRIGMQKYAENFFAHKLDGKTNLERMRITNKEDNATA